MRLSNLFGAFCACVLSFSISSAHAVSVLDFGVKAPTTSGTLSFAGADAPLIGTNIEVDDVVGLDTPSNNNVLSTCVSCVLNFTTGDSIGGWNFGSGGSISIVGGVTLDGATDIPADTALLTGTFDSAIVVDLGFGNFKFQIVGGSFTDTKDPDLLVFYGLPDVQYVGGLNISFSTGGDMDKAFTSTQILSGDITNQPVPVPPAVWLFGSGLLGLVGIARRKAV